MKTLKIVVLLLVGLCAAWQLAEKSIDVWLWNDSQAFRKKMKALDERGALQIRSVAESQRVAEEARELRWQWVSEQLDELRRQYGNKPVRSTCRGEEVTGVIYNPVLDQFELTDR